MWAACSGRRATPNPANNFMQTKIANSTHRTDTVLLLNQNGTADVWNNLTQRMEHQLSCPASIRHALRHDFAELTLAGVQWLRDHQT